MNTPELSAGRGGGLSQGLPATGPYRSLFRATSESRVNSKAPPLPSDAGLHILAEAAQSPEALSPVSAASPAPVPASTKRRKSSPLIASSPASSVPPPDTAQPSQNTSISTNVSRISSPGSGQPSQATQSSGNSKGKAKAKALPSSAQPSRSSSRADAISLNHAPPKRQPLSPMPTTELRMIESTSNYRGSRKNKREEKDVVPVPPPPALSPDNSYDYGMDYYPPSEHSVIGKSPAVHEVCEKEESLSPPPPKTWVSPGSSPATAHHYHPSAGTTQTEPSPLIVENSRRPMTPSTKPRMLTLLIEDRRHGTDELAEVRVPLKVADEGHFWADAKQVCAALQSGPARIDGVSLLAQLLCVRQNEC